MVKIDRSALDDLVISVTSGASSAKDQLKTLNSSLNNVVSDGDFRGKGADNTKSYLEDGPQTVTTELATALSYLAKDLKKTVSSFDTVDADSDAVLSTQELTELETSTSAIVKSAKAALKSANAAIALANTASDAAIDSLKLGDFETASASLKRRFTSAKEKLTDWDAKHESDMADDKKMFSSVSNSLLAMAGQHKGAGISQYNTDGAAALKLVGQSRKFELAERRQREKITGKRIADQENYQRLTNIMGMLSGDGLKKLKKTARGRKKLEALTKDWHVLKAVLRKQDSKWAKQALKLMHGSIADVSKRFAHSLKLDKKLFGSSKSLQDIYGYAHNVFVAGDDVFKGAFSTAKTMLSNSKHVKLVKTIGKGAKVAGWGITAASATYDAYKGYHDPKSPAYHSVGKSAVHAGVEMVKQSGPIEWATAGSATLGPVGAAGGFIIGGANALWGAIDPDSKDAFYDWAETGIDKVTKTATDAVDHVAKSVSHAAKSIGQGISRSLKHIRLPKLSWG